MRKVTVFVTLLIFSLCLWALDNAEMKTNISKCKYNDGDACHRVALHYYLLEMSSKKAIPFFQKACDNKEPIACYTMAYIEPLKGDDTMKFYLNKSCKGGYEKACSKLENMNKE